jgi:hypothetical protein
VNLLDIFRKPAPLRYVISTRQESLAAQRRRADRLIELAVYKATTTPEQRKAEAESFFDHARSTRPKAAIRREG